MIEGSGFKTFWGMLNPKPYTLNLLGYAEALPRDTHEDGKEDKCGRRVFFDQRNRDLTCFQVKV